MNERNVADVSRDLDNFYQLVLRVKSQDAPQYDSFLKIPAWHGVNSPRGKLNQPEDYANAVLAELGKFRTHLAELQNPTLPMAAKTHEAALVNIAERLKQHVLTYEQHFKNSNMMLCTRLKTDLGRMQQLLQRLTPPSSPRPRP
jgi:hypothetical protein